MEEKSQYDRFWEDLKLLADKFPDKKDAILSVVIEGRMDIGRAFLHNNGNLEGYVWEEVIGLFNKHYPPKQQGS